MLKERWSTAQRAWLALLAILYYVLPAHASKKAICAKLYTIKFVSKHRLTDNKVETININLL